MFFCDGAVAHASAGIVTRFPFSFARVQAATDVFVLQQQGRVVFIVLVGGASNQAGAKQRSAEADQKLAQARLQASTELDTAKAEITKLAEAAAAERAGFYSAFG